MRIRARSVIASLLLAAALLPPGLAAAEPPVWLEADQRFKAGVQLFQEADYAAALIEFERAYEIDPKYQLLYNIAQSHYQLQDYANALRTFRQYLEDGGTKIAAKRRKDVEAEIATLEKRVATLTIGTNEPGATVTVDDVVIGTTPLEPVMVSAGRRKVTAAITGRVPVTQIVDLAGGDEKTLTLEIPPAPRRGREDDDDERRPPPPPPPPSILPPVIGWSATGTLALGGVITGVLALGASSDLEEELARFPGDPDALSSAKSASFGLALATDILLVSAAVGAGVSIYLTVDYASEAERAETGAPPSTSARVVVLPGGLALEGTF